jgi:hypothetical protein
LSFPGTGSPAAAAFARSLEDGPEPLPLEEEPELLDPEDELSLELLPLEELSELELSDDELSLEELSDELLELLEEEELLELELEDELLELLEELPELEPDPEELSPLEGNGRGGSPRGALAMGPPIPRTAGNRTRGGSETRVSDSAP